MTALVSRYAPSVVQILPVFPPVRDPVELDGVSEVADFQGKSRAAPGPEALLGLHRA